LERKSAPLFPWFLLLLSLNILDISFTNPSYEANPFTLLSWAKMGILPSACIKVGLVIFFGILYAITKKVASPTDWNLAGRLLQGILIALVIFYSFIVTWNIILWI
jgi:hypothetical protein